MFQTGSWATIRSAQELQRQTMVRGLAPLLEARDRRREARRLKAVGWIGWRQREVGQRLRQCIELRGRGRSLNTGSWFVADVTLALRFSCTWMGMRSPRVPR